MDIANIRNPFSPSDLTGSVGKTTGERKVFGDMNGKGNDQTVLNLKLSVARTMGNTPVRDAAALEGFIQKELELLSEKIYEAEKAIIDNLKPSKEQLEQLQKRKEELEDLLRKLENEEVDYEQALLQLKNSLDGSDMVLFDQMMGDQRPIMG